MAQAGASGRRPARLRAPQLAPKQTDDPAEKNYDERDQRDRERNAARGKPYCQNEKGADFHAGSFPGKNLSARFLPSMSGKRDLPARGQQVVLTKVFS